MIEINKIHNADCIELMKEIDEDSIDCIWTDPPYNINYSYENYKDDLESQEYKKLLSQLMENASIILKPGGVLFIKQFWRNMPLMFDIFKDTKFKFWNLVIWENSNPHQPKDNFKPAYEVIFMFVLGDKIRYWDEKFEVRTTLMPWDKSRKENYYGKISNLWKDIPYVYAGSIKHPEAQLKEGTKQKQHPAQHPMQLVKRCIGFATKENDLILDPFMGSGTSALACKQMKRNFIGIEIDEEYCKLANKRLSQQSLFANEVKEK